MDGVCASNGNVTRKAWARTADLPNIGGPPDSARVAYSPHDRWRTLDHLQHESRGRPRVPARRPRHAERRRRRRLAHLRPAARGARGASRRERSPRVLSDVRRHRRLHRRHDLARRRLRAAAPTAVGRAHADHPSWRREARRLSAAPRAPGADAVRILIADDHALFRDGLRSLLRTQGHEVIAEARNGREAIELTKKLTPDLVLMDISMPEMDGLTATRTLTAEMPDVKVVILTASDDDASLFDAIKAGAQGYLLKNLEADDFFSMLDRASRGEPALTPNLARKLLQEFAKPPEVTTGGDAEELTVRERE